MRETWLSYQGLHLVIWQYSIHVWNKVQEFILDKKKKEKTTHKESLFNDFILLAFSYYLQPVQRQKYHFKNKLEA